MFSIHYKRCPFVYTIMYMTVLISLCREKVANGNYLHVLAAVLKMLEHALPKHSEGCISVTRTKYSLSSSPETNATCWFWEIGESFNIERPFIFSIGNETWAI